MRCPLLEDREIEEGSSFLGADMVWKTLLLPYFTAVYFLPGATAVSFFCAAVLRTAAVQALLSLFPFSLSYAEQLLLIAHSLSHTIFDPKKN